MSVDHVSTLISAHRSFLVAPAGCGKTEVIAKAVGTAKSRQLVLTHTHAGVRALHDRLKKLAVPSNKCRVDTIAGWALEYVMAFPTLGGLSISIPEDEQWEDVYSSAVSILKRNSVREMLRDSYSGVFVDEYQDCTSSQHAIIMQLAEILPCRIVGDPLQGIFGFKNSILVDWARDIRPHFSEIQEMTHPWRWINKGRKDLGDWLIGIRGPLLRKQPIDLSAAPLTWKPQSAANQRVSCYSSLKDKYASSVVIHKWPHGSHSFSRNFGGLFSSMEEVYCKDLLEWADLLEKANGLKQVALLTDFAAKCMTAVSTELKTIRTHCGNDDYVKLKKIRKYPELIEAILKFSSAPRAESMLSIMHEIECIPKAKPFRHELWCEMKKTIAHFEEGTTARETAWAVRSRGRFSGKRLRTKTSSRTLLIKGLEFDHAIVLDADKLTGNELYVAMTRGSKSLTVLSSNQVITPT